MRFKEEFIKELVKRLKENIDIIESSFLLANKDLVKNKLYNIEPYEFHLSILFEDDPYMFLSKLVYAIVNKQEVKVSSTNIACDLLLELVNLILDEFQIGRIGKIER
ncbi:MAG TPA: hypothetical protein IAC02_10330 [Candidatus Coprovivens excrementavium]|nr:hypothetical protein [Candidatus Coprovivens excrementavium]